MGADTATLKKSIDIQRRVIFALLMREVLTRYGRHNIGFFWLFIEPMIFTLGVAALWTFAKLHTVSNIPIIAFAITGYSSILLWRNMPNRTIGALEPNLSLMYHRNVRVLDIYLARLTLEVLGASTSFIILSSLFIFLGLMSSPENLLGVVLGWVMLIWFGSSLALVLGALSEKYEFIDKLWHPLTYLLFPLSGAAFNVSALPPKAQEVILILPMVHGVEMVREAYFGSKFVPHYDLEYLVIVCSVMSLLGFALLKRVSEEVKPE
jgi:ABC-type polysaccharide/polyol phosphate export permease